MAKILMVEDSAQLREAVSDFFMNRSGGTLTVETAADGDEGMKAVTENTYDLVILDIMLPGPSGYMICKKLREKSDCPIVPFSLMILYTKCLILMDRKVKKQDEKILESGDVRLYPSRMQVFVGENEIELAPKEYFLLKALLDNKGHVLGRQKLLDLVWGMDYFGSDRVVDTTVKNVRHKLGSSGDQIKTVRGGGYKAV